MRAKLTIDYIRKIIEEEGCELLSNEYINSKTKLSIRCKCGEVFEKTFDKFRDGQRQCKKCGHEMQIKKQRKQIVFNCENCGKEHSVPKSDFENRKHHFCSSECYNEWRDNRVKFNCDYCGKEKETIKSQFERCEHHFCSSECRENWKKNDKLIFNCEHCGRECSVSKSKFERYEHHFCSNECAHEWGRGENHPRYNFDLTDEEREKGRDIIGYKTWVKTILRKNNYTCQCCGQYSKNLKAHHLNGYNWDKEHRIDVNNGITLCEDCHKEFHNIYGWGDNTYEQFKEFLLDKYTQTNNSKFLEIIENIDLTIGVLEINPCCD